MASVAGCFLSLRGFLLRGFDFNACRLFLGKCALERTFLAGGRLCCGTPCKPMFGTSSVYWQKSGRCFQYVSPNLLISLRKLMLTMMDLASKAIKCNPESAIPTINTFSERSTMAQSNDKPWHL